MNSLLGQGFVLVALLICAFGAPVGFVADHAKVYGVARLGRKFESGMLVDFLQQIQRKPPVPCFAASVSIHMRLNGLDKLIFKINPFIINILEIILIRKKR